MATSRLIRLKFSLVADLCLCSAWLGLGKHHLKYLFLSPQSRQICQFVGATNMTGHWSAVALKTTGLVTTNTVGDVHNFPSIHPFSSAYPGLGCRGSCLSRDAQTSLFNSPKGYLFVVTTNTAHIIVPGSH